MVSLNATVYPNEAYVLVQTDWAGIILQDLFNRIVVDDWGAATSGQDWSEAIGAPAANYDVNGTRGLFTHTAVNTSCRQSAVIAVLDAEASGIFINTVTPTGGNFEFQIFLRYIDNSNFVSARIFMLPSGTVLTNVRQVVAGVETGSAFVTVPGVNTADIFAYRFRVQGSSLLFRAWNAGVAEPTTWLVGLTTTFLTPGDVAIGTRLEAAVTNPVPITFMVDNLLVTSPSSVSPLYAGVSRRNTVTGETVMLRPYIAFDGEGNLLLECGQGLWWDTEPPLNVPLEYCAVAADMPGNLAANSGFEGSTAGWTVTGGTFVSSSTFSHDGLQSGLFTPTGGVDGNVSQAIAGLIPGQDFTMSTWILSPQGWNSVRLRLLVTYTNGEVVSFESPVEIIDDGEWRFLQFTGTITSTVSSATLYLYFLRQPPNTTLFYVDQLQITQDTAVVGTSCETVTVSSESVWLKNPFNPCSDIEIGLCSPMLADCDETDRVSYVGHSDDEYAPNTSLFQPVNQRRPIPINRVRRDANSTLRILAHDCEARDAVLTSNEPGDPLLFQAPATYCIPDRYISVGVLTESRISVDQREDFRLMMLPYSVVNRPEGPANGVCGARIRDLCDIYTSWAAMTIADLTWTDLLLGEASPDGPGQPDPPVGLRIWSDVESTFATWSAVEADGTWADIRDGT